MDNIKTGALIRERRKEKGLTQRELAERLHVTDRAVSKWERGVCHAVKDTQPALMVYKLTPYGCLTDLPNDISFILLENRRDSE